MALTPFSKKHYQRIREACSEMVDPLLSQKADVDHTHDEYKNPDAEPSIPDLPISGVLLALGDTNEKINEILSALRNAGIIED